MEKRPSVQPSAAEKIGLDVCVFGNETAVADYTRTRWLDISAGKPTWLAVQPGSGLHWYYLYKNGSPIGYIRPVKDIWFASSPNGASTIWEPMTLEEAVMQVESYEWTEANSEEIISTRA